MKRAISFSFVMVALLFFARVAVAELIGVNDPSIVGDTQDGFNLTRDTDTGLDWLDITLSLNRSYDDVSGQLGSGGDYEGFSIATHGDLTTLFMNAELPMNYSGPVTPPILEFQKLFGSSGVTAGFYDDEIPGSPVGRAGLGPGPSPVNGNLVNLFPPGDVNSLPGDVPIDIAGVWLHRPVPEPSSFILCCIGGGLAWGSCRQRRRLRHSSHSQSQA